MTPNNPLPAPRRSKIGDALNRWWMESEVPDDGSVSEALQELDWLEGEVQRLTEALRIAQGVFVKYHAGFAHDAEQAREMAMVTQRAISTNPYDIEEDITKLRAASPTDEPPAPRAKEGEG